MQGGVRPSGMKLYRRAFRRRRALVPSKEPPLEEGLLDATITNIAEYTQSRGRKDLHRARLLCCDQKPLLLESPSAVGESSRRLEPLSFAQPLFLLLFMLAQPLPSLELP
ncbi:hypothetical protein AAHE18_17G150200 [Arachis hypogaea]